MGRIRAIGTLQASPSLLVLDGSLTWVFESRAVASLRLWDETSHRVIMDLLSHPTAEARVWVVSEVQRRYPHMVSLDKESQPAEEELIEQVKQRVKAICFEGISS